MRKQTATHVAWSNKTWVFDCFFNSVFQMETAPSKSKRVVRSCRNTEKERKKLVKREEGRAAPNGKKFSCKSVSVNIESKKANVINVAKTDHEVEDCLSNCTRRPTNCKLFLWKGELAKKANVMCWKKRPRSGRLCVKLYQTNYKLQTVPLKRKILRKKSVDKHTGRNTIHTV